jgi:NAD(P)-dependent dehydrogenase (short-subunit alcohol dehydrogenase family)
MIFVVLNSIFNNEADNPANGMFGQHFGLLGAVVTPPFAEHHSDISDLTQRGWFGCTLYQVSWGALSAASPPILQHSSLIRFDDLHGEHSYRKWLAYGQSKLANLLFAFELQREFDRTGAKHISVGCNPGYAATNLQSAGPRMAGSAALESMWVWLNRLFAVSAAKGAMPTLYAALWRTTCVAAST